MKQEYFIKWGESVYDVPLEFDRKYNLTTDEDIENSIRKERINNIDVEYQSRLEGFLMERISDFLIKDMKWKLKLWI
jgi:hypothetical protein